MTMQRVARQYESGYHFQISSLRSNLAECTTLPASSSHMMLATTSKRSVCQLCQLAGPSQRQPVTLTSAVRRLSGVRTISNGPGAVGLARRTTQTRQTHPNAQPSSADHSEPRCEDVSVNLREGIRDVAQVRRQHLGGRTCRRTGVNATSLLSNHDHSCGAVLTPMCYGEYRS